ncbi:xanthine dehydrogenase family protein molybdopterin-binding subunit [Pseudooceanicola spongiae]|uniref:Molybdopterin-dependent oxidoreductase n=1 Tax=Pseudooceanicola spongiae TaxID=2613965 RepID=A0A7L9WPE2_9RHOB|nr:xanthine dehydrogenase family protein molybdopterin-binding subunit [Pseudooceanicola spongiae]QOL81378.1 molybdopterin-dependent oxidoreductase [Pseudooceanicola spongiae]
MPDDFRKITPDADHGFSIAAPPRRFGTGGQSAARRDGLAKVTGAARYTADVSPAKALHGVIVSARIARGRVAAMNVAAAMAHPGVVEVMTPQNRPPLAQHPDEKRHPFNFRHEALQDDRVRYAGQAIAMVLGDSLEAATEGARLLAPVYEAEVPRIGFDAAEPWTPQMVGFFAPATHEIGNIAKGLADADVVSEITMDTPAQFHNAMEPHAIVAEWVQEDGRARLLLDTPNQGPVMTAGLLAGYLGIAAEDVVLRTPFIGGGFGSKLMIYGAMVLTALAARAQGRAVKTVLTRAQMYGPVGHRAGTRQKLTLGVARDGRLTALSHDVQALTSSFEDFVEPAGRASQHLYAAPNLAMSHIGLRGDIGTPLAMRAPGEASGSAALEVAMDVAADAVGLDPLEFRLRNYAEVDPSTGQAFSSKALRECYAQGAAAFGWAGRPLAARSMRDRRGRLLGWGMGTAQYLCTMYRGEARVILRGDGSAVAEVAGVDMGQGAWTILAQTAAEGLGISPEKVLLRSGSSVLPDGSVAGGSGHTATAGTALSEAGKDVVKQLTALALNDPKSPLFGAGNSGVLAVEGRLLRADNPAVGEAYVDIMARAGLRDLTGTGVGERAAENAEKYAMFSHGAVFAEVAIDPDLGQILVTRMVGAFAAGRILNPRMVQSQLEGGMIWGLSFALHEEAVFDPTSGKVLNDDLAGYHIPVHADIPAIQTMTVEEIDPFVNALGVKGVGEVGITGSVGAIANAIRHATGYTPTKFPIRIEDLPL